jgi:hypothetical protein
MAIILERHGLPADFAGHPAPNLEPEKLLPIDETDDNYVISTRIRTRRSIKGFALPPSISATQRAELEKIVGGALKDRPIRPLARGGFLARRLTNKLLQSRSSHRESVPLTRDAKAVPFGMAAPELMLNDQPIRDEKVKLLLSRSSHRESVPLTRGAKVIPFGMAAPDLMLNDQPIRDEMVDRKVAIRDEKVSPLPWWKRQCAKVTPFGMSVSDLMFAAQGKQYGAF